MCWQCKGEKENVVSTEEDLGALIRSRRDGRTWKEERQSQVEECEQRRSAEQKRRLLEEIGGGGRDDEDSAI